MKGERTKLEEPAGDPFNLLAGLGWCVSEQEDDTDRDDWDNWDEDVRLVSLVMEIRALAGWGVSPQGLEWDGSRIEDPSDVAELSDSEHVRLVIHMRSEERRELLRS